MGPMDVKLGRDTLVALAAVAWADGTMAPEEAASLRSAAEQLGLGPEDRDAVEDAIGRRVDPTEVETVRMNRSTRLLVFAAAHWMATVDGRVSDEEHAVLRLLGDRLGLSDKARERARQAALGAGVSSAGGRYDLLALRTRLAAGIGEVGDD
jgi:tellurite resistance protein